MGLITLISWAHGSFNGWLGCHKCGPECVHCYIYRDIRKQTDWQSLLTPKPLRHPWGQIYLAKTNWAIPFAMQDELDHINANQAVKTCKRLFTCSLSDFFHPMVDQLNMTPWVHKMSGKTRILKCTGTYYINARDAAWAVIRNTPQIVYLVLTKRPELIADRLPKDWGQGYPNVWLGTSVGCKQTLHRMDALRKVPVHPQAVRFVSHEPLLEDISGEVNYDGFGWAIAGGESGEGLNIAMTQVSPYKYFKKSRLVGGRWTWSGLTG